MFLGMSEGEVNIVGYRGTNEGSQLAGNEDLWLDGNLENNSEFGTRHFNATPSGQRNDSSYEYMSSTNYLWSSSEKADSERAYGRGIYHGHSTIGRWDYLKIYGYSIRCLQD
jgi:uncharacterized protein (TIGR02145 family)